MKKFFVVNNGEAQSVDATTLSSYPFVSAAPKDEVDHSEDWHLFESSGTQWCVAYAENDREALDLTEGSSHGLVKRDNVWCEISRQPYSERVQ